MQRESPTARRGPPGTLPARTGARTGREQPRAHRCRRVMTAPAWKGDGQRLPRVHLGQPGTWLPGSPGQRGSSLGSHPHLPVSPSLLQGRTWRPAGHGLKVARASTHQMHIHPPLITRGLLWSFSEGPPLPALALLRHQNYSYPSYNETGLISIAPVTSKQSSSFLSFSFA